jgi:hypothetical protein
MAPCRTPPRLPPLLLLLLLLLVATAAATLPSPSAAQAPPSSSSLPDQCTRAPYVVPRIPTRDQWPTPASELGRCTAAVEAHTRLTSHWCKEGTYSEWLPGGKSARRPLAAESCSKRGRMTVYRGPLMGWELDNTHVGACNATLAGSATHAMVAVSTRHLSSRQGAWEPEMGSCGSCMCIRISGADAGANSADPSQFAENVGGATGASFMGVVGDRCGECEDEHIDVLLERPLSFAPYLKTNPDGKDESLAAAAALLPKGTPGAIPPLVRPSNRRAPLVNRIRGPRVFSAAHSLRGSGRGAPETVGVYVADWQWAPCEWTHAQCAGMWRRLGYDGDATAAAAAMGARVPVARAGVDSDTGLEIASPDEDGSFCCAKEEQEAVRMGAPEVSDALPADVRAAVAARLSAAGGWEKELSAGQEEQRRAGVLSSLSAANATTAAKRNTATGEEEEEEEEEPMNNAAMEFAQTFTMTGVPLLARTRPAGLVKGRSGSRVGGGGGGGGERVSASSSVKASLGGGAIAGIVIGAMAGVAVLAGAAKIAWLRRSGAAAAAAEGAPAGVAAGSAAAAKGAKSAFVMPPPPASGNGAEMGGSSGR